MQHVNAHRPDDHSQDLFARFAENSAPVYSKLAKGDKLTSLL
jgi:hypothetical protein